MNGTLPPLHFSTTSLGFGSVKCHGHLITSNLQGSLYKQVTKYNYLTSLSQHSEFPLNFTKVNVHWESFSTARKEASFSTNIFLTKWLSGDTATGRVMVQRKARLGSQCPMCNHNDEHLTHVLTCPSTSAKELRNNLLSDLMVWLESVQTAPAIENFIHLGLAAWFENPGKVWGNDDALFSHDTNIDEALRSQLHLGWYYFLCGMQTDKFVNIQQEYYKKINSRRLGTRWATNVTQKMWKILHQIWKHRCNILHNTDALHNNSGKDQLMEAITLEYELGQNNLPGPYSSFFHTPLPSLLNKTIEHMKRWFLIVRTARETYSVDGDLDDFSFAGPLRSWIGLLDNG